jgi:hypothetical protein
MALSPVLNQKLPELKDLVYVKTNIGGWFFDAYLSLAHVSNLKITEHPVQTGANISDHAYLEPRELTIEVGMSDIAKDIVDGQFSGSWSRSVKAYEKLRDLQSQRIPMQVLTRLGLYKNMMITALSVPDDYKTLYGLRASVTMKEVLVATTKTVKISARPQTTNSTNRGQSESIKTDESILYQGNGGYIVPPKGG